MDYKSTLMWKEITQTPNVFKAFSGNNAQKIKSAAEEIKAKGIKHIYAVARGTSDHALMFFKYAMEIECGIPVTLGACSVVTLYEGALDLSGSLVIGCSQSGRAADVLEIIKLAKSQGAMTLSITNNEDSPLAAEAAYHLFCSAGEEKSVAATKTFSAQLFALLSLVAAVKNSDKIQSALNGLAEKAAIDIEKIDTAASACAKDYMGMKSGFILSRGITYAIAFEAALKLQETSYIQMKGYATSDFFHGPMAMVSDKTPVLIFAAKYGFDNGALAKNHLDDQIKGIDKMIELGADTAVITDDSRLLEKYKGQAKFYLIPAGQSEYFTMFNFALFAQMLACKISCGIGNNPDSPRALNKVTVTK